MIQFILRGALGIICLIGILWLLSSNKKAINWKTVLNASLLQLSLAFLVLKVPGFSWAFDKFSFGAVTVLDFTKEGSEFLFGGLITNTKLRLLVCVSSFANHHLLLSINIVIVLFRNYTEGS